MGPDYTPYSPVMPAGTYSDGATDISGAGGGFDFANFNWAGIANAVNGLIGTIGGLVLAGQNNTPYSQYGQGNTTTYVPVQQPQQQQGISATTIVVLVILLLLVMGIGYFVIKSNKK